MWRTDSLEKTLMLGKIEGRRRRGMTEDEVVGWHHRLYGHEFEQALGVGDGQGMLACYSPWGHKELDMTEWLNWTELFSPLVVSDSLITCGLPGSSVRGISQQEYWSGLPFSSLGNLPDSGIKLASPMSQADSLPLSYLGSHAIVKSR